MVTGDATTEGQATKPAVILDGRVNAPQAQRKIIVGGGSDFGYITCGANHDTMDDRRRTTHDPIHHKP